MDTMTAIRGSRRSGRVRLQMIGLAFALVFAGIFGRIVYIGLQELQPPQRVVSAISAARPDIIDRNGKVLAVDLPTSSVFAEPRRIVDLDEVVEGLRSVFPQLDPLQLRNRLDNDRGFEWVQRQVSPAKRQELWNLGLPGIAFRDETRRFYPNGRAAAHVLGAVNRDNTGIAGMESWIDREGLGDLREAGIRLDRRGLEPIQLTIDVNVQHVMTEALEQAMETYSAIAASGLILDVTNGEVIALASLPDFDPNQPADALEPDRINRINVGTYEMGSTFKALTTAMALESGRFTVNSVLDASQPLSFGRQRIRDYRGQNRPLTMPESFVHSSNIAFARMAMSVGVDGQREFLRKMKQLEALTTELPETARPIVPSRWAEINAATISFGHGIAVTPLQASMAIASVVNGGKLIRPTFVKGSDISGRMIDEAVVSPETVEALRFMMRLNAEVGSARRADVPGYYIGGKTGTAEKVVNGRYSGESVMTAFMGVAPADNPRYLFLTVIDEPKPTSETHGFRTAGWNAVPVTREIIGRALPMLDVLPEWDRAASFPAMQAAGAWGIDRLEGPRVVGQIN